MPHLVQMDKRYGKKGLQLIGAHVQDGSNEVILKKVEDLKMEFPVTDGITGPRVGGHGIPRLLIFNTKGKLVFAGHPMADSEKIIKKELRNAVAGAEEESSNRGFGLPERPKDLSENRSWTNSEGKQIQAALVSATAETATLRLPNGREVAYPVANLSEDDQAFITEKLKTEEEE